MNMINWKEQFDEEFSEFGLVENIQADVIKAFIQTEIIEPLINEIPDELTYKPNKETTSVIKLNGVKQELRDKWLN